MIQNFHKYVIVALVFLGVYWLVLPANEDTPTNIRLFCSNGRVFIEFQEKYNTWGTMWLNDDGMPVSCGREAKTKYKDMT